MHNWTHLIEKKNITISTITTKKTHRYRIMMISRRIFVWNALKNFNNFTSYMYKSKRVIEYYDVAKPRSHRIRIRKQMVLHFRINAVIRI